MLIHFIYRSCQLQGIVMLILYLSDLFCKIERPVSFKYFPRVSLLKKSLSLYAYNCASLLKTPENIGKRSNTWLMVIGNTSANSRESRMYHEISIISHDNRRVVCETDAIQLNQITKLISNHIF